MEITRKSQYGSVTIAASAKTSGVIEISESAAGAIQIPSTFTGTQITFRGCSTRGGTYYALYDGAGSAVSATVATSQWVALPANVFAVPAIKIVATSTQATSVTLEVHHRS